jgi:hypothetical protein
MKHRLRLHLIALSLALAHSSFAVDVTTKLGFESKYVTYGTKFAEETWVPMVDISQGDYYAGIWGYIPTHTRKAFEGEWDFFGGRTLKLNKLVSFDVGATVYHYPRTAVDDTTLEGFLWINLDTPLSPKLKLYYDITIKNWIGEVMISHSVPVNETFAVAFTGHAGFRRPDYHKAWYYGTVKADLVYTFKDKTRLSTGLRSTNNTDHAAVGHALENWFGITLARSW